MANRRGFCKGDAMHARCRRIHKVTYHQTRKGAATVEAIARQLAADDRISPPHSAAVACDHLLVCSILVPVTAGQEGSQS